MPCCTVCGETKSQTAFKRIPRFRSVKKHKVCWCQDCQKMFMEKKVNEARIKQFVTDETKFVVSFE